MTLARLPTATLLPGGLSDEEIFWHWRRSLMPMFDCVPLSDPREPSRPLQSTQYHVGEFLFVDARYPKQRFIRDAVWARRHDDADHVLLQIFLHGSNNGSNGGKSFVEEVGGVYAVNLGYETDAISTDANSLSLVMPRQWLADHLPALCDASGELFARDGMATRLFTDFMLSLRRNLPHATIGDAPVLSRTLIGMLDSLLAHADPLATEARNGTFQALQHYIDDNLNDVELGPDRLCTRFRMSRASLFRLFKDHGGVRTYIQRRRLMACFRALSSARQAHRLIYDIALDFGFTNPSHLSTLFRQHFGMSPREIREAAQCRQPDWHAAIDRAGDADPPDVETMRRWANELGRSGRAAAVRPGQVAEPGRSA